MQPLSMRGIIAAAREEASPPAFLSHFMQLCSLQIKCHHHPGAHTLSTNEKGGCMLLRAYVLDGRFEQ